MKSLNEELKCSDKIKSYGMFKTSGNERLPKWYLLHEIAACCNKSKFN